MLFNLNRVTRSMIAALSLTAMAAPIAPAMAKDSIKVGVVAFLTGAGAGPFGIPAKNAAELVVDAINNGSMPAPYNSKGSGGTTIEAVYVDEAGGSTTQVTEMRNLVQRENVDAIVGYISSGSCLAVAPVAEELKVLTVLFDCGTPRIFEEAKYRYVFRTQAHATMDNVAAARYAVDRVKKLKTYSGVNQNYAWGQDSWRDFTLTMKHLKSDASVGKKLFPKIFAGEYGSEISSLLVSGSNLIHSSLWGGDMESFVFQAGARGLLHRVPVILTTGESAMHRLKNKLPNGAIVGARGSHGALANDTALNRWFQVEYTKRFGTPPTYPSYHMAQAFLGLKAAMDKAAGGAGKVPSTEQTIDAFEGLEFESVGAQVKMALSGGHQAISETAYGTYKFNRKTGMGELVDVIRYPAECVNPPEGVKSVAWLESGMPDAKCN